MSITAQTMHRPLRVLARLLLLVGAVLFVGGLAFRATLYWKMPVAPGDPYGLADVIEYGVGMLLLLVAMAGFVLSLVFVFVRKLALVRTGIFLLAVSLAAPIAYASLHTAVARWTAPAPA